VPTGDFPVAQRNTARKTRTKRYAASPSAKRPNASRKAKAAGVAERKSVGDQEVTIDRRRAHLQQAESGEMAASAAPPKLERRKKVNRRRQIDPTTCERDYTGDEIEFMNALDDYKRKSGRMFPTCSEVLEVVRSLGYVKLANAGPNLAGAIPESSSIDWLSESGDAAKADQQAAVAD
jgi:hypothetical protein